MRPPKRLRISARRYEVSFDMTTMKASDSDGVTIMSEGRIILKPGQADDRERETLLHEVMHACFDQTGLDFEDSKEERIISSISPMLFSFLCDNPKAVEYLTGRSS